MLVLDFINVGNGDSILIQELEGGARRFAMLVDCISDTTVSSGTTTRGSWTQGPSGFTPGTS